MVLDASQAAPQLPIVVAETGADLIAFTGHKVVGPTGIGVLWGRREVLEALPPDAVAWLLGVEDPFDTARHLTTVRIARGAIVTSSQRKRRFDTAAGVRHHLIDPRTGASALTDIQTVTVIAATGVRAEAISKSGLRSPKASPAGIWKVARTPSSSPISRCSTAGDSSPEPSDRVAGLPSKVLMMSPAGPARR